MAFYDGSPHCDSAAPDSFEEIGNKAAVVRAIELTAVLERMGCVADRLDKAKWHTPRGVISVTGPQFMNWSTGEGGGGAIDLALHLTCSDFSRSGCTCFDFKTAVLWLSDTFSPTAGEPLQRTTSPPRHAFSAPRRNNAGLSRVMDYLRHDRCIPGELLDSLVESGKLYADRRANAVFLLLGKGKTIVGAELRGTTHLKWHGMSPGSRKDLGCFSVGAADAKKAVLCESAIDAVSCAVLYQDCIALSTSGAHPNPPWLSTLITKGLDVYCGFDADDTGDSHAHRMLRLHPTVKRLRSSKHDWNEVLQSRAALL